MRDARRRARVGWGIPRLSPADGIGRPCEGAFDDPALGRDDETLGL